MPPQVVYRFAQSLGVTLLSGTTDETHMREDLVGESLTKSTELWVFRLVQETKNDSHNHDGAVGAAEIRVTFENVCDFERRVLFR